MNLLYFWIFIIVASIILELLTVSALVSIWFAIAAACSLLLYKLGFSFFYQTLVFFIVSAITLIICRPLMIKNKRGNRIATNMDRFIGKQAKLNKEITEFSWGEVKIDGIVWNVTTIDGSFIEKEKLVEVLAIEGSKLIVKEIKEDNKK